MFVKKLNIFFFVVVVGSIFFLITNMYQDYIFDNNPLSEEIKNEIRNKELKIIQKVKIYYGINFNPPLIISSKMPHQIYGLSSYTTQNNIEIFLNKKRFKESKDYMINDVLAHEYAHALMFKLRNFSNKNAGHSIKWQKACIILGGRKCNRFVNYHDIAMSKARLWK